VLARSVLRDKLPPMWIADDYLSELSQFIRARTREAVTDAWVRSLLTNVISGPESLFDLQREGERLGVAFVIDTCETVGNAAALSIFPVRGDDAIYRELLDWGEAYIAQGSRDLVDLTAWPGVEPPEHVMHERGYRVGYAFYDMTRPESAGPPPEAKELPAGWSWRAPDDDLVPDYYETRAAAFEDIPGAYLPPYETFRALALEPDSIAQLAVDAAGRAQAFVRVTPKPDGGGEISSLGRHPRCRGQGLGPALLGRGLELLWSRGARRIALDVAANNETAIALYRDFDFEIASTMNVYRKPARARPAGQT
jgi:ribosomal protein S18 acetylase RimI-like enzyme